MAFSLFDGSATNYLDFTEFAALCSHICSQSSYHKMGTESIFKTLGDIAEVCTIWQEGAKQYRPQHFPLGECRVYVPMHVC